MSNGDGRIIDPTRMPPPGSKMMAINVQLKQDVVMAAAVAVMKEMNLFERLARLDRLETMIVAVCKKLDIEIEEPITAAPEGQPKL